MKKLLFLVTAVMSFAMLMACEKRVTSCELVLYGTLTPDEFDTCVKQGVLTHIGDPSSLCGRMVAVKRSSGDYTIGFIAEDLPVGERYIVVLERPVADSALTKPLPLDQLYMINPPRTVIDALAGISVEAGEASCATASAAAHMPARAAASTGTYPFELYRRLTSSNMAHIHELATRSQGVPLGCVVLVPAQKLDWKEIVHGLLVVVPRSSGDYSVGYISEIAGGVLARKVRKHQPLDVVVEKPRACELATKSVSVDDMHVVVRFMDAGRRVKFKVTDIDCGTCLPFE